MVLEFSDGSYIDKPLKEWTTEDWINEHNDMVLYDYITDIILIGFIFSIITFPYWYIKYKLKEVRKWNYQ